MSRKQLKDREERRRLRTLAFLSSSLPGNVREPDTGTLSSSLLSIPQLELTGVDDDIESENENDSPASAPASGASTPAIKNQSLRARLAAGGSKK